MTDAITISKPRNRDGSTGHVLAKRSVTFTEIRIEIAVTGLRPDEKLYEELLIGDNPKPTVHPRIMKAHEEFIPWAEFEAKLTALEMALNVNDVGVIRLMMQQLVAGYIPSDDIVDWVYLEQEAEAKAIA
ncbi:polysaccharide biosynthesis protein [Pseudomonas aeruginosa]|uniref:polysaccharide biosynthesis protein n=1 Tax=Pseudomonas aeruginosa TaxID=287 RepID=UPI0008FB569B|nr:polysaccharide biosynthesis protein [Pseudomonas aeruginosa]